VICTGIPSNARWRCRCDSADPRSEDDVEVRGAHRVAPTAPAHSFRLRVCQRRCVPAGTCRP